MCGLVNQGENLFEAMERAEEELAEKTEKMLRTLQGTERCLEE